MKSKNFEITAASRAQKFVDRLLTEGTKIGCNESQFKIDGSLPSFYDEELYKKGQQFFYKNYFAMFFAKFHGLLAILAIPQVLKILIMTEKSGTNYTAYVRYMSTIFHMLVWYKEDFKPGSNSWKSVSEVNKKHSAASKKSCSMGLHKISQKDMALTQFGFMGFQISRAERVGIYNTSEEEWRAFLHLWRVVGYLMGIEDRFNICSGSVEETKEICNLLIERSLYPAVAQKEPEFLKMSSHLIGGMWSMNPCLMYKIMMNYLYHILLRNPEDNNNKSAVQKYYFKMNGIMYAQFYLVKLSFYFIRFNIVRKFFNALHHLDIWFMENFPILVYYSYGNAPNAIVKIKL